MMNTKKLISYKESNRQAKRTMKLKYGNRNTMSEVPSPIPLEQGAKQ